MKNNLSIILISFLLIIFTCGKPLSKGADDELMVLTALEDQDVALRILGKIFKDTLYTPAPEPYFKSKFIHPEDMGKVKNHPNLIVVSVNNDLTNPGTRLVKGMLPKKSYDASKSDQSSFIISKNVYADQQTLLVISGSSEKMLLKKADEVGENIYALFDQQFINRQSRFLFNRARKKEIEQNMVQKYDFGLKIPWGYTVVIDSAEAHLFWIGREQPFRWVVIHWEDGMVIHDQNDAREFAKNIPERFFNNIQYIDYKFTVEPTLFNEWSGWRLTGLWESVEDTQGGPFIAYTFYDGITDRTYYIHTLIFNPGEDKYLFLRQLDIIARSFYVNNINS